MLLRRVTKDVRNQNWVAIGIDFAIVVIGVFIGLQATSWNEEPARGSRPMRTSPPPATTAATAGLRRRAMRVW